MKSDKEVTNGTKSTKSTTRRKKRYVPAWKKLMMKGYKVYNDGLNNAMFLSYSEAAKNGFPYEGYAPRSQTTHFHYRDLYGKLK